MDACSSPSPDPHRASRLISLIPTRPSGRLTTARMYEIKKLLDCMKLSQADYDLIEQEIKLAREKWEAFMSNARNYFARQREDHDYA